MSERLNHSRNLKILALVLAIVAVVGAFAGYTLGTFSGSQSQSALLGSKVSSLESEVSTLQSQINAIQAGSTSNSSSPSTSSSLSLNSLYESVKGSVVTIEGLVPETGFFGVTTYSEVLGSGFVVNLTGTPLVVTNYHVIDGMVNGSVTFIDGSAYSFTVLGSDQYSDLAVLQIDGAPASELNPLTVVSSQTLNVGDKVIAVGSPYGLQSTITSGIVSQLNRAIQTSTTSNYLISGLIQISTPINSGNSGSPLFDAEGRVVGITNAIVSGSNNVGFAVPSDALIREINDLVTKGSYSHAYLGINGISLDYLTAQAAGLNITYGVLVQSVASGSPAATAGLRGGTQNTVVAGNYVSLGGDVIIKVDSQPVRAIDDLTSYLEDNASPGQTVNLTVVRGGSTTVVPVVLGSLS